MVLWRNPKLLNDHRWTEKDTQARCGNSANKEKYEQSHSNLIPIDLATYKEHFNARKWFCGSQNKDRARGNFLFETQTDHKVS